MEDSVQRVQQADLSLRWVHMSEGTLSHIAVHKTLSLIRFKQYWYTFKKPASVAQSEAHPTGDQEVAGSIPSAAATFFRGD